MIDLVPYIIDIQFFEWGLGIETPDPEWVCIPHHLYELSLNSRYDPVLIYKDVESLCL